jgi:hypothetical protein
MSFTAFFALGGTGYCNTLDLSKTCLCPGKGNKDKAESELKFNWVRFHGMTSISNSS